MDQPAGRCGLSYGDGSTAARLDGLGIVSWHLCADLQLLMPGPNTWPNAGSGIMILWDATLRCQTGPVAVAGYFVTRSISTDVLRLIPRPGEALAAVTDCAAREYLLGANELGDAAFSPGAALQGYNPAVPGGPGHTTPVRPSTRSGIKAQYGAR